MSTQFIQPEIRSGRWAVCWRLRCRARSVQEDRRAHAALRQAHEQGTKAPDWDDRYALRTKISRGLVATPAVGAVAHAWLCAPPSSGVRVAMACWERSALALPATPTRGTVRRAWQHPTLASCEGTRAWPSDTPAPGLPRWGHRGCDAGRLQIAQIGFDRAERRSRPIATGARHPAPRWVRWGLAFIIAFSYESTSQARL